LWPGTFKYTPVTQKNTLMAKHWTIQELDAMLNAPDTSIYRLSLFRGNQKQIGWNASKKTVKEHWKRIRAVLCDKYTHPGIYQLLIKKSASSDATPEVYETKVGEIPAGQAQNIYLNEPAKQETSAPVDIMENPTIIQFLSLHKDITELRMKVEFLNRDNSRLETELEHERQISAELREQVEELQDEKQLLSETQKPAFVGLLEQATPFIEQWFEVQKEKAKAIQHQAPKSPGTSTTQKTENQQINYLIELEKGNFIDVRNCEIESLLNSFTDFEQCAAWIEQASEKSPQAAKIIAQRINQYMKDAAEQQQQEGGENG